MDSTQIAAFLAALNVFNEAARKNGLFPVQGGEEGKETKEVVERVVHSAGHLDRGQRAPALLTGLQFGDATAVEPTDIGTGVRRRSASDSSEGGESTESSAGMSWADEMAAVDEAVRTSTPAIAREVGVHDVQPATATGGKEHPAEPAANYVKAFVKNDDVKAIKAMVEKITGRKYPRNAMEDLAVARHTAAAMPKEIPNGRARLTGLSRIGENALVQVGLVRQYRMNTAVDSAQAFHSAHVVHSVAARALDKHGFAKHVVGICGGNVSTTMVCTAMYAVVGAVQLHIGNDAVLAFGVACGLFS